MADKTMTLNLTEREMVVLNGLAESKGMSKTAVMRQALRLYQMVDRRMASGARLVFSDEKSMLEVLPVLVCGAVYDRRLASLASSWRDASTASSMWFTALRTNSARPFGPTRASRRLSVSGGNEM